MRDLIQLFPCLQHHGPLALTAKQQVRMEACSRACAKCRTQASSMRMLDFKEEYAG